MLQAILPSSYNNLRRVVYTVDDLGTAASIATVSNTTHNK